MISRRKILGFMAAAPLAPPLAFADNIAPEIKTHSTYGEFGVEDDLADLIYNISPLETPFLAHMDRADAGGVTHKWKAC